MTCSLVIAGSIGLCLFQYFNAMVATTAIEEAYRSITVGELVVRSSFVVYLLKENGLDVSRAERVRGWRLEVSLADGLARKVAYFRESA